jgi:putative phosphoesterase
VRIGLLGDSHIGEEAKGKSRYFPNSLYDFIQQLNVDLLFHTGDLTNVDLVLPALNSIAPTFAVQGDNDPAHPFLPRKHIIELDEITVAILHGDRPRERELPSKNYNIRQARVNSKFRWWNGYINDMVRMCADDHPNLICCGHIHTQKDETRNGIRIVNPGAVFVTGNGIQQDFYASMALLKITGRDIQVETLPLPVDSEEPWCPLYQVPIPWSEKKSTVFTQPMMEEI